MENHILTGGRELRDVLITRVSDRDQAVEAFLITKKGITDQDVAQAEQRGYMAIYYMFWVQMNISTYLSVLRSLWFEYHTYVH